MVTTSREATNTISTRMLLELGALIGKYNADDKVEKIQRDLVH